MNCFQCNSFIANASKCHLFSSPCKPITIKINESAIECSNSEKRLGVTMDSKSFDDHITNLSRKVSQRLHTLSMVACYMSFDKKDAFIASYFNYCHSRGLNNRINNIHECALRILYQDKKSDFGTLPKSDKSVTIHVKKHYLASEICKVKNNTCPDFMRNIFHFEKKLKLQLKQ